MIMWITTGLIVFEEAKFYSRIELLKILGSILICCVGIKILTMKTKILNAATNVEKSERDGNKSFNDSKSDVPKNV